MRNAWIRCSSVLARGLPSFPVCDFDLQVISIIRFKWIKDGLGEDNVKDVKPVLNDKT